MNVYDTANKLAQEIKDSAEYVEYKKVKEKVNSNQEVKEKINEFEKLRYDIQVLAMQGTKAEEAKTQEMQKVYVELIQNDLAKEYFNTELRFNVMLADVNKIIGEAVQEVLK